MTRSFTSMLALLLRIVAGVAPDQSLAERPRRAARAMAGGGRRGRRRPSPRLGRPRADRRARRRAGPRHRLGVVPEADRDEPDPRPTPTNRSSSATARSRSASRASSWSGSSAGPGATEEARVLREASGLGAETWLIDSELADRGVAGWSSLVGHDLHPWARLPLLLYPGQALAFSQALVRGREPRRPAPSRPGGPPRPGMIRLADYRPRSSLRVPATRSSGRGSRSSTPTTISVPRSAATGRDRTASELLATLDEAGVETLIDLDGGFGDGLSREVERWQAGRAWTGSSCSRDSTTTAGPGIRRSGRPRPRGCATRSRRGARGLKVWKLLGLRARDPGGRLVAVDDERLDPLWATAAELDLPVVIHIADPVAFFQPLDATNERYEELTEHPDWHFWPTRPPGEPDAPGLPDRSTSSSPASTGCIGRHPATTFVGAHVGCAAEDLGLVSRLLDSHPNLSVDIAARLGELGRQPYFGPGVLPPSRRSDPVRHRRGRRTRRSTDSTTGSWRRGTSRSTTGPRTSRARVAGRSTGSACPTTCSGRIYRDNARRVLRLDRPP